MDDFTRKFVLDLAKSILEDKEQFDKEWTNFEKSGNVKPEFLRYMEDIRRIFSRYDSVFDAAGIICELLENDKANE